jgi:hypothetical protein
MAVQSYLQWDPLVLQPVFRGIYQNEMDAKLAKDFIPQLYGVETSEKALELFEGAGGEGLMVPWKESNNQVAYGQVEELWKATFTHEKFSLGREIDRDFIDDLKLPQLRNIITTMADAVYKTQQMQAAQPFNNAFTATGSNYYGKSYNSVGPDGKKLVASDHPYSPENSTDTQSNVIVSGATTNPPLDIDAWDAASIAMQGWVDDRGVLQAAMADTILVAPKNMRTAFQIAGIDGKGWGYEPGSNQFNVNVYEGVVKVIVSPFLTNADAWFAIDSARLKEMNKWFWRRKPENGTITDFDTEVAKFKVIGRWSFGWTSPWFLMGSNGSGTA